MLQQRVACDVIRMFADVSRIIFLEHGFRCVVPVCHHRGRDFFQQHPKKEIVDEARTAIEAAKALDPGLPDIYTSEGALKFYYDWDWEGAIASYKKALELDPRNATIYI